MKELLRIGALAAVAAFGFAGTAPAATMQETGDFGGWMAPVAINMAGVSGTGTSGDVDAFHFTLPSGAQTLSFDFTIAGYYDQAMGGNYRSGGYIVYSFTPFQYDWDEDGRVGFSTEYNSWEIGKSWEGHSGSMTSNAPLKLGDAFSGDLWLALVFTDGDRVGYNVTSSALSGDASALAPVPLPAGVLLLGSVMGGLGLAGAIRSRRKA